MKYSIEVIGGVKARLKHNYDILINMVFDLMEEIDHLDMEDFNRRLKERELAELNKQARYIDELMNLEFDSVKIKNKNNKNDSRKESL